MSSPRASPRARWRPPPHGASGDVVNDVPDLEARESGIVLVYVVDVQFVHPSALLEPRPPTVAADHRIVEVTFPRVCGLQVGETVDCHIAHVREEYVSQVAFDLRVDTAVVTSLSREWHLTSWPSLGSPQ